MCCFIHRVTSYRASRGVRVRLPSLPFGKEICHQSNLPKVEESSASVVGDKHPAGFNPKGDRATYRSSFTMCSMANISAYSQFKDGK